MKINQKERDHSARALRQIHGALVPRKKLLLSSDCGYMACEAQELEKSYLFPALLVIGGIICAVLLFSCSATPAHAYTDEQYANAIRKAEGTWTYGIKTIKCQTEESCRKICIRTVHNNRIRFEEYGQGRFNSYLSYLASRYAPIGAGNDPSGLNQNWVKNVAYFLSKESSNV